MRPRKPILIYCQDELWRERVAWVIGIRMQLVTVTSTGSLSDVEESLASRGGPFECVVVACQGNHQEREWLKAAIARAGGGAKDGPLTEGQMVLEVLPNLVGVASDSPAQLTVTDGDMAGLLEKIRTLVVRKRGPKKWPMMATRSAGGSEGCNAFARRPVRGDLRAAHQDPGGASMNCFLCSNLIEKGEYICADCKQQFAAYRTELEVQAQTVECKSCKAAIGKPCRSGSGKDRFVAHACRDHAARRAQRRERAQ